MAYRLEQETLNVLKDIKSNTGSGGGTGADAVTELQAIKGYVDGVETKLDTLHTDLGTLNTAAAGQAYTRATATWSQTDNGNVQVVAAQGGSTKVKLRAINISAWNTHASNDDVLLKLQDGSGAVLTEWRVMHGQSLNVTVVCDFWRPETAGNQALNLNVAGTTHAGRITVYYETGT